MLCCPFLSCVGFRRSFATLLPQPTEERGTAGSAFGTHTARRGGMTYLHCEADNCTVQHRQRNSYTDGGCKEHALTHGSDELVNL